MATRLRALGGADRGEALDFLGRNPLENLFLAAKIAVHGIDRRRLGSIYAYDQGGRIASLLLDGEVASFVDGLIGLFKQHLSCRRLKRSCHIGRGADL